MRLGFTNAALLEPAAAAAAEEAAAFLVLGAAAAGAPAALRLGAELIAVRLRLRCRTGSSVPKLAVTSVEDVSDACPVELQTTLAKRVAA
jgi:hypothetical protein